MFIQCSSCGKCVSSKFHQIGDEFYVRAYVECPECLEKNTDLLAVENAQLREQLAKAEAERDAANLITKRLCALGEYEAIEYRDDNGVPLVGLAWKGHILGPLYDPTYEPYELCEKIEAWLREYVANAKESVKHCACVPAVYRPATGRTIPDLTGMEHVCQWQSAVKPMECSTND